MAKIFSCWHQECVCRKYLGGTTTAIIVKTQLKFSKLLNKGKVLSYKFIIIAETILRILMFRYTSYSDKHTKKCWRDESWHVHWSVIKIIQCHRWMIMFIDLLKSRRKARRLSVVPEIERKTVPSVSHAFNEYKTRNFIKNQGTHFRETLAIRSLSLSRDNIESNNNTRRYYGQNT